MPKPSSKSGKSSKTARVLNLLTDPESVDEAAPQPAAPSSSLSISPPPFDGNISIILS